MRVFPEDFSIRNGAPSETDCPISVWAHGGGGRGGVEESEEGEFALSA